MRQPVPPAFIKSHLLWPLAVFCFVVIGLELTSIDVFVADRIYAFGNQSWQWRDVWFTSILIHNDGRKLVALFAVILVLLLLGSYFSEKLKPMQKGLWYLAASAVAGGVAINVLKHFTHVDCPWDLLRYGGEFPYIKKFAEHPQNFRTGACFPAGHASAGYAWFGLYFFTRDLYPRWQRLALAAVLLMGLVFGIGQQLRGAHFLSHDVWTLGLCWFCATLVYLAFGKLSAIRV